MWSKSAKTFFLQALVKEIQYGWIINYDHEIDAVFVEPGWVKFTTITDHLILIFIAM